MSDWQRVQSIFLASADLPVDEQDHALDALCEGDLELLLEVKSLLVADSDSSVTIDSAIQGVAATILDTPILIGERLGAYRVVREIGRGGMGSVYLALRDDEEYTKEVALKVVKRGMNTEEVLRRFRAERQILANLDHPYIARLFDGGTTADGVPFFAMEYVEGRPVDVFCRENSLSVKARCELFLHILEAVGYAHRNLVVHGDLKPANIFVTPDGTPKLLDFGVAKIVATDGGEELSSAGSRAFTPGYASPEQVRGTNVTTSTDIYSLGAVLYELLSGKRAQPVDFDTPTQIEHAVCDVEVLRPGLEARDLPPDLDDVVLMALCKEPERRYQSATQFADDIRRCLEGRPVIARPNTVGYRAGKFVMRNRVQVAMGALVAVALVAGLVVSLAQTHRARAERAAADSQRQIALRERADAESARASEAQQRADADEQRNLAEEQRKVAENERDKANSQKAIADQRMKDILQLADRTLFGVHDVIAPLPGSMPARKKIVETTLEYLQTLEKNVGDNDELREALTAAYYKVSRLQGDSHGASLQDFASAEQTLRKALALLLPAYRRHPEDGGLMMRWIEVQSGLSDLMYRSGREKEAVQIYLDLLPVARRVTHSKPCHMDCQSQEVAIEATLVYDLQSIDAAQALEHATRGIALSRSLLIRNPDDVTLTRGLAVLEAATGGVYRNLGNLEKAGESFRDSLALRERLVAPDPSNLEIQRGILVTCGNYALVLGVPWSPNLGRPDEARTYAARAVAIARTEVAADAKNATARFDLAMSLGRLGMIDPAPGQAAESLAHLQEARKLMEPIVAANPKSVDTALNLAQIVEFEAIRQQELGHAAEAEQAFQKSMALIEPFAGLANPSLLVQYTADLQGLALLQASNGDHTGAAALAGKAVAVAEKSAATPPASDGHVAMLAKAWSTVALTQAKAGSADLARQSAEKAMQLWSTVHKPGLLTAYRKPMADTRALLATTVDDTRK